MENFELTRDIELLCLKASSYPEGIVDAQRALAAVLATGQNQNYFGVSYMYDDAILYMAAVERADVSAPVPPGCTTYTLKKGTYISIYLKNYAEDLSQVEKAFQNLLAHPSIDENGCCAEWYLPEGSTHFTATDLRCMVRLADDKV